MELEPVQRLNKDLIKAATTLSDKEARYLVDAYYIMQDNRIRTDGQIRAMGETNEPNSVIQWLSNQNTTLEGQIKRALDKYSDANPIGQWAKRQVGIGPVIAAGLLAHIDITKAPTVGHIWSYAGLNPKVEWKKGEKRPWNATLKVLCWKIGESFVKVSNKDDAIYGKIYKDKKDYYISKNEAGDYAERCKEILSKKNYGKETIAYKAYVNGKLPDAHIHAMAKRHAVCIFLSHLHHVWYLHHYNEQPPKPFALAHLDHVHMIDVPE